MTPHTPNKQFPPFFFSRAAGTLLFIFFPAFFFFSCSNSVWFVGLVGFFLFGFLFCFCYFFCLVGIFVLVFWFFSTKSGTSFRTNCAKQHTQAPSVWGWNSCMAVITSYTWKAKHELCQMVPTGSYIAHILPCILQICREMGMAGEEQKGFILYPLALVRALQCNNLTHMETNSK